jgi:hypothetical protein
VHCTAPGSRRPEHGNVQLPVGGLYGGGGSANETTFHVNRGGFPALGQTNEVTVISWFNRLKDYSIMAKAYLCNVRVLVSRLSFFKITVRTVCCHGNAVKGFWALRNTVFTTMLLRPLPWQCC